MKMRWLIPMSGLLVWMLGSCTSSNPAPSVSYEQSGGLRSGDGAITRDNVDAILNNPRRPGSSRAGGGTSAAEAFAAPKKERPGLATTFGRSINSPMPPMSFERASSKPYGIDAIYYNDREGLKAMDALGDRVDGYQEAAGSVIEWGIKGGMGFLPSYKRYSWSRIGNSGNRRFVQGSHGSTYSIVLRNRAKCDLQVVLSVDGLDVVDGKAASVSKRGYVIPAGKTLEVEGYRTGYNSVAAFQFSTVSNSYANLSTGDTRNVGVIGLAVYLPKGGDPWTYMPKEIEQRRAASPFAQAP